MSAVLIEVADAVTAEINSALSAGTFGAAYTGVTAERSYADWDEELTASEASDLPRIDVVPVGVDGPKVEIVSRSAWDYTVAVDVGVRKRLGQAAQNAGTGRIENSEVDALVLLLEKIGKYFMPSQTSQSGRQLVTMPEAVWLPDAEQNKTGTEFRASYDRELLRRARQYLGIVRLTFCVTRKPGE